MTSRNPSLHQWFTPAWAAEALVEQEFGWLAAGHVAVEPACGDGAFLCVLPEEVRAIGCEIDPRQAALARQNSGREVIVGDFLAADIPQSGAIDLVIGNPPFEATLVAGFLERSHQLLREGGEVGFILPAYILQTSSKVEKFAKKFSIHQSLLPRNLFPGLHLPLTFVRFVKEHHRQLFGFLLYAEAQEMAKLDKRWNAQLVEGRSRRGVWFPVVDAALIELGGEASLQEIYEVIEGRQPSENPQWQAKVRQVVRRQCTRFVCTGKGRYARVDHHRSQTTHEAQGLEFA